MNLIRSIVFNIYLSLMVFFYAIFCLATFLFLSHNIRYYLIKIWCKHFVFMCRMICGIQYHIVGIIHIEQASQEPSIILSKHQSAWETIALFALLPCRLCYVFKKELLYIPFFGWVLGMLDMLYINRKDGKRAFSYLSKQTKTKLEKGYIPILFPEGTRSLPHQKLEYKSGGARLAMQNKACVIPISHNAGEMWPKNSFIKTSGIVNIHIGQPMYIENQSIHAFNQAIQTYIESNIIYNTDSSATSTQNN
jgi:1-acyl-sn-glycerol-3-phosphate acyltransferase